MAEQELTPKEKQELREKEQTRPGRYYVPDVDIYEDAEGLWVSADMPGVDEKSVDVELENNVLTMRGEVSVGDYEGLRPVYTEYNVGPFLRRFTLGAAARVDRDNIRAQMTNGVLRVHLPKAQEARPRRIEVSAG